MVTAYEIEFRVSPKNNPKAATIVTRVEYASSIMDAVTMAMMNYAGEALGGRTEGYDFTIHHIGPTRAEVEKAARPLSERILDELKHSMAKRHETL
jgi:hypothetical protein